MLSLISDIIYYFFITFKNQFNAKSISKNIFYFTFFLTSLITNVIEIYFHSYSLCFCSRNIGILEMLNICRKKRFESVPVSLYRKGQRNKGMRRACLEVDSEILGSFRGTAEALPSTRQLSLT